MLYSLCYTDYILCFTIYSFRFYSLFFTLHVLQFTFLQFKLFIDYTVKMFSLLDNVMVIGWQKPGRSLLRVNECMNSTVCDICKTDQSGRGICQIEVAVFPTKPWLVSVSNRKIRKLWDSLKGMHACKVARSSSTSFVSQSKQQLCERTIRANSPGILDLEKIRDT